MWSVSCEDGMRFIRCHEYQVSWDLGGVTVTLLFVPEGGGWKRSWWYIDVYDLFSTLCFRLFVVDELLTQDLHSFHCTVEDFLQFQVDNLHHIRPFGLNTNALAGIQKRWVCYGVDQVSIRTVSPKDTVVDLKTITTKFVGRKVTIRQIDSIKKTVFAMIIINFSPKWVGLKKRCKMIKDRCVVVVFAYSPKIS